MRRRPRAPHLAAAFAALALLAAACPSPEANEDNRKRVPGGTLRVAVRDLATLDPAKATGRGAAFVVAQLFDPLTRIDPATGEAVAGAATSWETSPDGKTWTFRLNPAARFHNNSTVSAGDFKLAFDRLVQKATSSDASFQLESVKGFRDSKIVGTAKMLTGVTIANASTLKITLDRAFSDFAEFVAHPALAPLPHTAWLANPAKFPNQPIGNGPFKMAEARDADTVKLVRNDEYTGERPLLDGIEIQLYESAEAAWRAYLDGKADVAEVPAAAIPGRAGDFGAAGGFTPFWAAVYYGANLKSPVLGKQAIRQGISLAIDRQKIAREVYGGTKAPATGIVPRGVAGFQPDRCGSCVYDKDRASELIRAATGGKATTITIDHLDASPSKQVAEAIGADLLAAGLKVAYRAHNSQKYLALLQSGKQELAELGWLAEVPSPDGFLAQQLRTKSPNNQTGYTNREFDGYIDQARAQKDRAKRLDFYRQAEELALRQMPLIPIVFFRNHVAVARRVHGLQIDGAGLFDATKVWMSPAK